MMSDSQNDPQKDMKKENPLQGADGQQTSRVEEPLNADECATANATEASFATTACDEALFAAEKGLEAARAALEAAERKLAEAQRATSQASSQEDVSSATSQQEVPRSTHEQQAQSVKYQAAPAQGQEQFGQQDHIQDPSVPQNASWRPNADAHRPFAQATGGQGSYQQTTAQQATATSFSGYQESSFAGQGAYQPQQQPAYQQPPIQPHYAAPAASRDHVAAGLLAIFLGFLGVHKFYLGYNTQGFIMLAIALIGGLFSFGIVLGVIWIIAFIEGIIYLTKSQSEFERLYVYSKREWF